MIVRLWDEKHHRYVKHETAVIEIQIPVLQIITDGGWPIIIDPREKETNETKTSDIDRSGSG